MTREEIPSDHVEEAFQDYTQRSRFLLRERIMNEKFSEYVAKGLTSTYLFERVCG